MFNSDFIPEADDQFRVVDPVETTQVEAFPLGDEMVVQFDGDFTFDFTFDFTPAPPVETPLLPTADPAPPIDTDAATAGAEGDGAATAAVIHPTDPAPTATPALTTGAGDPAPVDPTPVDVVAVDVPAVDEPADPGAGAFTPDLGDLPLPGLGFDLAIFI